MALTPSHGTRDIEDIVCPPTHTGIMQYRRPAAFAVSVSTLLARMAGYCEAQGVLRTLNGQRLLPRRFLEEHGHFEEEKILEQEVARHGADCSAPGESREFATWRRRYARLHAELTSVRDTIDLVGSGRRGILIPAPRRMLGPGVPPDEPDEGFARLQSAYAANFVYLSTGSYVHRKLEFADHCFVEHITSVTRASGATRHYSAQMIRLIASCINIALFGKTNEMPVYMYTRMDYDEGAHTVEHLISGVIDSIRTARNFDSLRYYVTDYKTHGRVVIQKPEHRAQVWIYAKMLHTFADFPVRRVHALLLREDGIDANTSMSTARFVESDMAGIRHDLRFFMRMISASDAEHAWFPDLFTNFRRGISELLAQPALSFTQIAECAVHCVTSLLANSPSLRGTGSTLHGEIVYYPRDKQDYHHRSDAVGQSTRYDVGSCHGRANAQMADDDDDLTDIISDALHGIDGFRDLSGPSTNYACGGCEYAPACEFKPM